MILLRLGIFASITKRNKQQENQVKPQIAYETEEQMKLSCELPVGHFSPRFLMFGCCLAGLILVIHLAGATSAQDAPSPARLNGDQAKANHILLIVSDDLRANVLGCYGDKICRTPNLDKLAKRGMVFERAYCQAMWCAPSRQSFMHSRYQGKVSTNLGSHLIKHGFYSARVGKIFHMRVPGDIIAGTHGNDVPSCWTERFNSPGLEAHTPGDYACLNLNIFTQALAGRQSTGMPHRPYVTVQYDGTGADQPDFKSADKAIEILRKRAATEGANASPFFLAVGLIRPHYPMVAPRQYFKPYPWETMPVPEVPQGDLDDIPRAGWGQSMSGKIGFAKFPKNKQGMWAGYYASVSFMDAQVGRILDELDRLGLRETTTIIFTSDHGYHLGEHEFWQKSNLHEDVTRVPLIIDAPGRRTGRSLALVELVDLFPTIAELGGVPIPETIQGKSLVPVLKDDTTVRDAAVSLHKGGIAIRTDRYSYIRYANRSEEFYDMQQDPQQYQNLVDLKTRTSVDQRALVEHRKIADQKIEMLSLFKKK